MFTEERQKKILDLLQRNGRLRIAELTEMFGVSEVTLRSDLSTLARQGYLTRTHGGALLHERSIFPGQATLTFGGKDVPNQAAKRRIGKKAAEFIRDGMNVLLDAGTTILEIARNLHGFRDLTVITDSIPVAVELSGVEEVNVLLTGGVLRPASLAVIGPESWSMLERIHVQRAFIGARGVSLERGFFCGNTIEGKTKRRMMACAEEKFAVVDSSKFNTTGLVQFAGFEDFDCLLVDRIAQESLRRQIEKKIKLVTCSSGKSNSLGVRQ
ncbi:MAG TPA: DeoR/GlpR family DNA-binding transcription regulator [Candidatus Glassbacteria bacterium]|nr:DeoR/GlpR family DNA-binding transcription regulator [Candidatus Glassbacteria bacterium]